MRIFDRNNHTSFHYCYNLTIIIIIYSDESLFHHKVAHDTTPLRHRRKKIDDFNNSLTDFYNDVDLLSFDKSNPKTIFLDKFDKSNTEHEKFRSFCSWSLENKGNLIIVIIPIFALYS